MCNVHQGLVVGETYTLDERQCPCLNCGNYGQNGVAAKYIGHEVRDGVSVAMFRRNAPCLSCGYAAPYSGSFCDGGNYYEVETAIPVENWPIKKEAIT